jgi:mRNA interferase RelE/StbE
MARDRISALATDPRGFGVIELKGEAGYRLRVGSHRVLFVIDDAARRITITGFGPRTDSYRR